MPPLVSVIIPVYNVKQYLRECMESVLKQTYKNLEIIMIDDGSTDGSAEICDEYQEKDRRIVVIHQKNQGLSGARNSGLDVMHGELVAFLDSDDAILPTMIEIMVKNMDKTIDVVVCGYYECKTTGRMDKSKFKPKYTPKPQVFSSKQALNALIDYRLNIAVWNKLYKSELFKTLRFADGHMFEDLRLLPPLLKEARKVKLIDQNLLLYRIRPSSITTTCSYHNLQDWIDARKGYEQFVIENTPSIFDENAIKEVKIVILRWLIRQYFLLLSNHMPDDVKRLVYDEINARAKTKNVYNTRIKTLLLLFQINPHLCYYTYKMYRTLFWKE